MSNDAPRVLGTAAHVARLLGGDSSVHSLYGPEGSPVYHFLTRYDEADAEAMLEIAEGKKGTLLELACGSGRLTFPFLENGFDAVGLDMSPHMLSLFAERLEEEKEDGTDYSDRVSTVQGDMTSFSLDRTFDFITLGANAVSYLGPDQRASLFASVREHLAADGRFLMTLIEFPGIEKRTEPFETQAIVATGADADIPMLLTLLDFVDPVESLRSSNFLAQRVEDGAIVDAKIFTALSHVLPAAPLRAEIEAAGMRVLQQHEVISQFQIQASFAITPKIYLLEAGL
ncbi:ubiquinone/menaquinone biosynthesis methyltransferase [Actinomadura rubteroloni]|uniref:Ubiquinone/menaquinone biosynthesis methyltransferase n=1 Tax=Actinomadura rubteroloni TaxID=1926885 RepID=A0A2P4UHJ3_9ACTN|nr:daptide-type RiPP biosynthesis methyltransferase [Actinomadura rubteroloni]POM24525.1 ubiquinone/menaquinone biosynthesis methyltransferase [Actinomadura rubteroloni]